MIVALASGSGYTITGGSASINIVDNNVAEEAAKTQLLRLAKIQFDEIRDTEDLLNEVYDSEAQTDHGSNQESQADWEADYKKKIDAWLKEKFKWEK